MNALQPKNANAPKELGKPLAPGTQVTRIRFAPDGKTLAAACFDGKVRRWDTNAKDATELPAITGHNGWVTDIAFSEKLLFSADSWGRLTAWDGTAKEPKRVWTTETAHDGWLRALALSADGAHIATCGKDGFVRVWDCVTGKKVQEAATKTDTLAVRFAADGKTVYAGDLFGIVRGVDALSGKITQLAELKELYKLDRIQDVGGVKCLALSGDGKTLFAGGAEPKTGGFVQCIPLLIAIDTATGKRLSQYKGANDNEGYVTDIVWHKSGHLIFSTSGQPGQGKFHFWKPGDATSGFSGGKQPNCHSIALHPDGDRVAVSATNANSSGNGRVKGTAGDYPENTSPIQLYTLNLS